MIGALQKNNEEANWEVVLDSVSSSNSNLGESGDDSDFQESLSNNSNVHGDQEATNAAVLYDKVEFVLEDNEKVKDLLRDLNLAFRINGRQEKKRSK